MEIGGGNSLRTLILLSEDKNSHKTRHWNSSKSQRCHSS